MKKTKKKKISPTSLKNDTVNQIKNVSQEKKIKLEIDQEVKVGKKILIDSFDQLLNTCNIKKEIKLKYELEKNVNLVNFENNRIEISFNDKLDKNFVKDLSLKLFEWTGERWIITFSKIKGDLSIKDKEKNKKIELVENAKKTQLYETLTEKFSDAELTNVFQKKKKD